MVQFFFFCGPVGLLVFGYGFLLISGYLLRGSTYYFVCKGWSLFICDLFAVPLCLVVYLGF